MLKKCGEAVQMDFLREKIVICFRITIWKIEALPMTIVNLCSDQVSKGSLQAEGRLSPGLSTTLRAVQGRQMNILVLLPIMIGLFQEIR